MRTLVRPLTQHETRQRLTLAVLVALAIAAVPLFAGTSVTSASMGTMGTFREARLLPPDAASMARGEAMTAELADGSQHFGVEAKGLDKSATFTISLDGAKLGDVKSDDEGHLRGAFGAPPKDKEQLLPAAFLPVKNIKKVEIADAAGKVVLAGSFDVRPPKPPEPPKPVEPPREVRLLPSDPASHARGEAFIALLTDGSQHFGVEAKGLDKFATFTIQLDGAKLDDLKTDEDGELHGAFGAPPFGRETELPAAFLPVKNIKKVEILDGKGAVVLAGTFGVTVEPPEPPKVKSETCLVLKLTPTADAPKLAEGIVAAHEFVFVDDTTRRDLKVAVDHLDAKTAYDVVIDGVHAGTITTDDEGEGRLFLSTKDIHGAEPWPKDLGPVSKFVKIDVVDPKGKAALTGNFADARHCEDGHPAIDYLATAVLRPIKAADDVSGMAMVRIADKIQEFKLGVWGLKPTSDYKILIDGAEFATFKSDDHGRAKLEFSTKPDSDEKPIADKFLPVSGWLKVEVATAAGDVVAGGNFRTVVSAGTSSGSVSVHRRMGGGH